MCHETDARPPLPPIRGGAIDAREVELTSADGTRFAGHLAVAASAGGTGDRDHSRRPRPAPVLRGSRQPPCGGRRPRPGARPSPAPRAPADEEPTSSSCPTWSRARTHDRRRRAAAAVDAMRTRGVRAPRSASTPWASASAAGPRSCRPARGMAWPASSASTARWPDPGGRACLSRLRGAHVRVPGARPVRWRGQGDHPRIHRRLRRGVDRGRDRARLVTYPGAPHSFFDRTAAEHAAAAQDAWRRVLNFVGVAVPD